MNVTNHQSLDDRGGELYAWLGFALFSILVTGLAYPALTATIGGALFHDAARGSLVERDGRVVGSSLVAQPFADARYFVPRPSAAGYAGMGLAGSNWAPSNPALHDRIATDSAAIAAREGVGADRIPADLVTASGGGWDPHISPAGAELQVARVARARSLDEAAVRELVAANTEGKTLGVLGQPRVNVLMLNLALDDLKPEAAR